MQRQNYSQVNGSVNMSQASLSKDAVYQNHRLSKQPPVRNKSKKTSVGRVKKSPNQVTSLRASTNHRFQPVMGAGYPYMPASGMRAQKNGAAFVRATPAFGSEEPQP